MEIRRSLFGMDSRLTTVSKTTFIGVPSNHDVDIFDHLTLSESDESVQIEEEVSISGDDGQGEFHEIEISYIPEVVSECLRRDVVQAFDSDRQRRAYIAPNEVDNLIRFVQSSVWRIH